MSQAQRSKSRLPGGSPKPIARWLRLSLGWSRALYVRDGFVVTLWTYYEPVSPGDIAPAEYAQALERLHAGMREIDLPAPHFTDRVAEAQRLVGDRAHTPELGDADRELLEQHVARA